ncbi:hypothetical protein [Sedimentisphaera salicampi]|uniref:Uncharacterized protein n=1 Tax=Sedimentisphaera salicampi TaxID=1941349 RepID=A0A1W6LL44_9BACT|nr:hypothetical protein [Sedimentisphaera salicampi]ARN56518.1 hypothetical protein STSP1_00901 [Sedimentisphaera salicampi]
MKTEDIPKRYRKMYERAIAGKLSAKQAIKCHCIHCFGWKASEARKCENTSCPLYPLSPAAEALRERQNSPEEDLSGNVQEQD